MFFLYPAEPFYPLTLLPRPASADNFRTSSEENYDLEQQLVLKDVEIAALKEEHEKKMQKIKSHHAEIIDSYGKAEEELNAAKRKIKELEESLKQKIEPPKVENTKNETPKEKKKPAGKKSNAQLEEEIANLKAKNEAKQKILTDTQNAHNRTSQSLKDFKDRWGKLLVAVKLANRPVADELARYMDGQNVDLNICDFDQQTIKQLETRIKELEKELAETKKKQTVSIKIDELTINPNDSYDWKDLTPAEQKITLQAANEMKKQMGTGEQINLSQILDKILTPE